jgi:hypothetical protein
MTSQVDVINQALDNIAAKATVSSISPPNNFAAQVAARHYQPKLDALFRGAHWNCARLQAPLTVLRAAQGTPENPNGTTLPIPPYPWQYEYGYPADCLKVRFLLQGPPVATPGSPPIFPITTTPSFALPMIGYKFEVGIDTDQNGNQIKVILTDLEFALAVYTGSIANPDLWDPHFLIAATANLGMWLVNPLNRNAEILKEQIAITREVVQQARVSDGNEGMTTSDHLPDWMRVRGTLGFGMSDGGRAFYGWDPLALPVGGVV